MLASDIQTDNASRPITFHGKASLYGYIATVFTLAALGAMVMTLRGIAGIDLLLQGLQSVIGDQWVLWTLLFGITAAWFWRIYVIRKRPLLRIGREGVEVNLGVAVIKGFPIRLLTALGLMRIRFGWIAWGQLQRVEARPSVIEYHKAGRWGGLVLEGVVLIVQSEGPNPSGVAIGDSLAILSSEFPSTPAQVAAKIQPYLDDPNQRQSLASLFQA